MAHLQLLLTLLLLAAAPHCASSISLLAKLRSTPHLSTFTKLLEDTGLATQMDSSSCSTITGCFLVFAPTNAAFKAAYPEGTASLATDDKKALVRNLYKSVFSGSMKGLLANWPHAGTPQGIDVGFGQVQVLETSDGVLYWLRKRTGSAYMYHVNNAKVNVPLSDNDCDNGVFHVVDQVPLPIGQFKLLKNFLSDDARTLSFLKISKSVELFTSWMEKDSGKSAIYGAFRGSPFKVRTVFLPTDAGWDSLGADGLAALNNSVPAIRQLLSAHFALNYTLFTAWMREVTSLNFTAGVEQLNLVPAKMFVDSRGQGYVSGGGVVAKFQARSVNYPLQDAVIHVIDRPLGFLFRDLASLARANAPGFYSRCEAAPSCRAMLRSTTTNYTLFVPQSVDAIAGLNSSEMEKILKLHFVENRRVGRPEMQPSLQLEASSSSGRIRFSFSDNNMRLWVNGALAGRGYVASEMVRSDQPATNGMLHIVTVPLGAPSKNVREFVTSFGQLANVSEYIGVSDFDPALNDPQRQLTVFAPTNAAVDAFRQLSGSGGGSVGLQILANRRLRDRVFRRTILPNRKVVTDSLAAGTYDYDTANTVEREKVQLAITGSAGAANREAKLKSAGAEARVDLSSGPWECTNGVVYLLQAVLYREADAQGYPSDGRRLGASSGVVSATSLLLLLLLPGLLPRL